MRTIFHWPTTIAALTAVCLWLPTGEVAAQSIRLPALSAGETTRNGLEKVWTTHIELDRGRSRIVGVTPFVSSIRLRSFYEVTYEFGKATFSEKDLDLNRQVLGREGANEKAEDFIKDLKVLYPDSKVEPISKLHTVAESTLFVTTDGGTVQAIDAETGITRWTTTIGNPSYPTTEAGVTDRFVAVLNGSTIYVLKTSDGTIAWTKRMAGVPTTGPTLSDEHIFVPNSRGIMESYTLLDARDPPWNQKSNGHVFVRPVYGNRTLAWPSDSGHIYVMSTSPRNMRYRLETKHTVDSVPAIQGTRLFATSVDGYLYCLNLLSETVDTRRVLWKFAMGEPSGRPPVPVDNAVFVTTDSDRLFCVSQDSGRELWRASGVKRYVAATKSRVYVMGEVGRMLILDTKSGARLAELSTEQYDLSVPNIFTDRIYLGTSTGVLQCLREVGARWPHLHGSLTEPDKPRVKIKQKKLDDGLDGEAKPKDPAGDPFGAGDDPFGGDKPKAMKGDDDPFGGEKPKPKAADDDPFGTPPPKMDKKDDPFG